MKNRLSKTAGAIAIGIISLISPLESKADEARFYGSANVGSYFPSQSEMSFGGIPFGFGLGGDYGNNHLGFLVGGNLFFKSGDERIEYGLFGQPREGEKEWITLTRIYSGLRIGSRYRHISGGGVVVEDGGFFRSLKRTGVLGRELSTLKDRRSLYGIFGKFKVGNKKFFFEGGLDYFFPRDEEEAIKSASIGLGINFGPKE